MKNIVIDYDTPFLCEQIIRNILKRLPAKSLIRFQCLCKHWKNLINDPSFIADHFHHSTQQNPCLLFQPRYIKGCLHLLDCEMQVLQVPNHALIDCLKWGYVIGSSNGLLCAEIGKDKDSFSCHSLLLCNPAIREFRHVPTTCAHFHGSQGFGFSPIVNDYKVVKIHASTRLHDLIEKVEVYSFRTGLWKGVELGILDGAYICSTGFTANGAIYWVGFKKLEEQEEEEDENGYDVIISFDIAMEVFTLIPMPTGASGSEPNTLTTYENKLAILSCRRFEKFQYLIDLWVMEEGASASGERYSWTKKYTSNPYSRFLYPLTIWRNEIVCNISAPREMENDKSNIVLLNLTTNEFTKFAFDGSRCGHRIFNYVESLIPVGGMKLSAMFV